MKQFFRNNGLSFALLGLFLMSLLGQSVSGMHKHNNDQKEHGKLPLTYREYVASDDFLETTAENWESESPAFHLRPADPLSLPEGFGRIPGP